MSVSRSSLMREQPKRHAGVHDEFVAVRIVHHLAYSPDPGKVVGGRSGESFL